MRCLAALALSLWALPSFATCDDAYWNAADAASYEDCKVRATSGDASAQFGYGLILMSGHDRVNDPEKALEWFRAAAMQRHFLAQVALGRFLSDERFLPVTLRNEVEAYAWWSSSEQSEPARSLWDRLTNEQRADASRMAAEYERLYGSHP
jgi:TPR repeat protein